MLDQQDGEMLSIAHTTDLAAQYIYFVVIEAGSGLIQQQKFRAAGQRSSELNALANREWQPPSGIVCKRLQVQEGKQLLRPFGHIALFECRRWQTNGVGEKPRRRTAVAADLDVVENAHVVEQRHVLEGTADADL